MKHFIKTVAAASVLASAGLFAASAQQSEEFTFAVDRAELTSQSAVRVAYQRLNAEAERYCGALPLQSDTEMAYCRADVVDHVISAVSHEGLQALHVERTREARYVADRG
ncbi:UrcA family protein [Oceanicaulis sp. 350]|jgi:UrcA family protein|nr:UrcA family protein [Oceanicaulis sp.]VXC78465.1 UrcA family protein [Oceanicaulis sp. 350]